MKILTVAEFFPWPSTSGGLIRLAQSIETLSELGEVDLFSLYDRRIPDRTVPSSVPIARLGTTPYPDICSQWRWRPSWLVRRGTPMEVAMRRLDVTPRAAFESWAADRYDLVWFSTAAAFEWLGRPDLGPTVVDLIDLESEKEKQRARLARSAPPAPGASGSLRRTLVRAQAHLNAHDWAGLERSVARAVDRVLLCSDVDVERSGLRNATVVSNTYPRPSPPVGHGEVGGPPVILFQGSFNYAPNMDGAAWLVHEIAPRIRSRVRGAEVRLVGPTSPAVNALHAPPRGHRRRIRGQHGARARSGRRGGGSRPLWQRDPPQDP